MICDEHTGLLKAWTDPVGDATLVGQDARKAQKVIARQAAATLVGQPEDMHRRTSNVGNGSAAPDQASDTERENIICVVTRNVDEHVVNIGQTTDGADDWSNSSRQNNHC